MIDEVIAQLSHAQKLSWDTVLVTIIGDNGSSPRNAGSQMLVGAQGRLAGTIGGGALEKRSESIASTLLDTKQSGVHDFLSCHSEGIDLGMVCGGDVCVHFQYIAASDEVWGRIIAAIADRSKGHRGGWLVLREDGGSPTLLSSDQHWVAGEGQMRPIIAALDPRCCIRAGGYFSMPLTVGHRAIIFGAGHIARRLCPLLRGIDFRPVIYDSRPEFAVQELFPDAEQVICGKFTEISTHLTITEDDFIVSMSNTHASDCDVEDQILRGPFAYLGVIGSKAKIASINRRLLERGIKEEQLSMVHTPIGTAIKADTPAEIAISIAGEMILIRAWRREEEVKQMTGQRKTRVACGSVVVKQEGAHWKTLLIQYCDGHWSFPKGRVESGESEEETALRETREETGLTVKLLPDFRAETTSVKRDVGSKTVFFLGVPVSGTEQVQLDELAAQQWFSLEDAVPMVTYPEDRDVLQKAAHHLTSIG